MTDTLNDTDLCRLLDNRWMVQLSRSVDGRYLAVARKPYLQSYQDVLPKVDIQENSIGGIDIRRTSEGIPSQRADADSPSEALRLLAAKVFGCEPSEGT